MALRLIEVYLPSGHDGFPELEEKHALLDCRELDLADGRRLMRLLLDSDETEPLLEMLDREFSASEDYRIILLSVEATVPRPEKNAEPEEETQQEAQKVQPLSRISREELYQDINDAIKATTTYYLFVILSTVVAAGGMLRDSPAVVIGAMVIAPLIGPNIALALGTTLGDADLLRRALKTNVVGLLIGFALSVGVGLLFEVLPGAPEVASRTSVDLGSVVLALAAGVAGALSFTRGLSNALIGVMVAVALLPPLVAVGMLVGSGHWGAAYGALLLTATNVAAVNLAGVVTFLVQGVRPMRWYEAKRAKQATRLALALWVFVLALLVAAILLSSTEAAS